MQALILAAGMGSRLGKFTKDNTKCMLTINGRTLIEHMLSKLYALDITKITIVVGYKKENLISHIKEKFPLMQIDYIENSIFNKTNNIYSLYLAKEALVQDDTILLESDLIFDQAIIDKLLNDKRKSLAVVDQYKSWMDGTSVTLDTEGNILAFIPKSAFRFQDVNNYYKTVNIYKFSKEFSKNTYVPFLEAYSKAMGDNEYYEQVLRVINILEKQELKALVLNKEKWYEIDDIQDKDNAEVIFANSPSEKLKLLSKRYGGYWRYAEIIDFCYLVNPYFPTQKMQEEMKAYFQPLISQYPSGQKTQNLLASKMFSINPENITIGNGASEIIRALPKSIAGTFGIMFPTFNEYPESIGYDRVVKGFTNRDDLTYSTADLEKLIDDSDNVLLINPDNPSGNFIDKHQLIIMIEYALKYKKRIIIDESFVDFAENGENHTLIDQELIDQYPNLLIIKSISKSYGVPGIRLGVAISSNKELINKIQSNLSIWNINSFAEYFLQIIGKYKVDYKNSCFDIREERNQLFDALKNFSFLRPYKSEANYFLCQVNEKFTATELTERLLEMNIYIKDLTGKIGINTGKNYVRIAVRNNNDNKNLINALNILENS